MQRGKSRARESSLPPPCLLGSQVGGDCVITGGVRINEESMPLSRLRKIMGFVPQDDIVHCDLTVRCVPMTCEKGRRRKVCVKDLVDP